ncbi:MAG: PAS domain S-box protein [Chitinophagaceae bacterium]|nr:MAG: PAS domain S-box protein [Chitinophagaceae bacterium]
MPPMTTAVNFSAIFQHVPAPCLIIGIDAPVFTILDVNEAYLQATNSTRESLIGTSVFAAFPANPTDNESKNIERTIHSFNEAIRTGEPHVMSNYRYDIPIPGTDKFEQRYWTTSNTPIRNEEGEVIYFIHSPANVTELNLLAERERANLEALQYQRQQLELTLMQAPVGILILQGPQHIVELINPPMCELYDLGSDELLGKPLFSVLTLASNQGFQAIIDKVRQTGEAYRGYGEKLTLMRRDRREDAYVNYSCDPFRDESGVITGVVAVVSEVTEQVEAKIKTELAEERARLAVTAVGLGIFDVKFETDTLITSPQFDTIFGFDESRPYQDYKNVIHPDDRAHRDKAHQWALANGTLFYEARVTPADKPMRWIRAEGKVFYDEHQHPVRLLGTVLDITNERKATEEKQKLITLADNSVDLMSILDLNGVNSYINQAGRNMLGFVSEEDVQRIPVSELHAPEEYEKVKTEVLPGVMSNGHWSGELLVRHLYTGEVFPVYNNCIRIDDPVTGEPIAVGAVMRDMRPELTAKKALADSEQLLRNITTAAPTALWMTNGKMEMTYINQTWLIWTNSSYEDNLNAGWLHYLHIDDRQKVIDKFASGPVRNNFYDIEFRIIHADGTVHWCTASGQPQFNEQGEFTGYIGACVDITDQKSLQQQKDDFIGIASHELKTPVTSIKGYTQLLEQMLTDKGDMREAGMMQRLDKQVNRLTNLIGDLLDVTKINSGKLQFNETVFDFNPMVRELVEDLQRTTVKHTLIEQYEEAGYVYADKERIGQVITNLISNAIKYSPGTDEIIIHTWRSDNNIILSVQDFGIGIAEEKLGHVFEQFYRVSGNMQHSFPGLGIGLYISSEIIKREMGAIWATSEPGKGSVFSFQLPILD